MNSPLSGRKYFELDESQLVSWLRLIRSQNVGPATFRDLISRYGTAAASLEAIPELAKRGGAAARIKVCSIEDAERELYYAQSIGAQFIGIGESAYPSALRSMEGAPPLICVKGSIETLNRKTLGIVGSRNASIAGMKLAHRFARQIGEQGYAIASGLARGIDTKAHEASLETGTTAVFAGGIDKIFPHENQKLADKILDANGALVTEMPIGWEPRARDFPKRNRIITGLAQAVLVIEAARRSGSLITARLANEAGRTVLAIPGSPLDPRSEGTNKLIREGATLVTSQEDIMEALLPIADEAETADPGLFEDETDLYEVFDRVDTPANSSAKHRILYALGPSPVLVDDIIEFAGVSPGEVQLTLLELTLAGYLERHPGGLVSLPEALPDIDAIT